MNPTQQTITRGSSNEDEDMDEHGVLRNGGRYPGSPSETPTTLLPSTADQDRSKIDQQNHPHPQRRKRPRSGCSPSPLDGSPKCKDHRHLPDILPSTTRICLPPSR